MNYNLLISESREDTWERFKLLKETFNIPDQLFSMIEDFVMARQFELAKARVNREDLLTPKETAVLFLIEDFPMETMGVKLSSDVRRVRVIAKKLLFKRLLRRAKNTEVTKSGYFLTDKGKLVRSGYAKVVVGMRLKRGKK